MELYFTTDEKFNYFVATYSTRVRSNIVIIVDSFMHVDICMQVLVE